MNARLLLAGVLAIASHAVPAVPGAEELEKTRSLLARAEASDFGARYEAYSLHLRPQAEVREMERENRLCREELVRLNPVVEEKP